jgi:predicted DNA-binding transcriptional regulator AlpA
MPQYLSRTSLAATLEISESTLDEMVRRGVIPKPVKLSSGCVRFRWASVDAALASMSGNSDDVTNPKSTEGVRRAIEAAKERWRR